MAFLEQVRFSNVPEPGTVALTGLGLLLLLALIYPRGKHKV